MLYLNPNKEKVLTFEVELSGASVDDIKGFVRFIVEGVEVGFPAHIGDSEIKAVISPLKNFLKKPLKNGTVFEAQLDLYTEDQEYFSPWKGEIEVKMPVTIEAKLADESAKPRGGFGARVKTIKEDTKRSVIKEEKAIDKSSKWTKDKLKNIKEEDIIKYMERAGTKNKTIQEIVLNEAAKSAAEKGKKGNLAILQEVVKVLRKPR